MSHQAPRYRFSQRHRGFRIGPEEVVGAVVDHFQAAYLASLLGLIIKSEDGNSLMKNNGTYAQCDS
ncbi:hypothetical protein KFU94_44665, partial [Chloroflexi bacterium TSY]|nr:hypothetical protein [Chloroflexi bacterium TSY]